MNSPAPRSSRARHFRWVERAQEQGFDEVILLNEHGRVAECTSANHIRCVWRQGPTPPVAEGCLPGVTRAVLLEEIRVPALRFEEAPLTLDYLYRADEVLITSTTRGLLPVREIAGTAAPTAAMTPALRLSAAFHSFFAPRYRSPQARGGARLNMPECPSCGSRYLRPSRPPQFFGESRPVPIRLSHALPRLQAPASSRTQSQLSELRFARCPQCFRMDLTAWSGRTFVPPFWSRVKLMFGAHRWRCEYCRLEFLPACAGEKKCFPSNAGDGSGRAPKGQPSRTRPDKRPGFTVRLSEPPACSAFDLRPYASGFPLIARRRCFSTCAGSVQ